MELTGIDSTNKSYFEPLLFLNGVDSDETLFLLGVIHADSPVAAAAFGIDMKRRVGRIVSIYTRPDMRRKKAANMLMGSIDTLAKHYRLVRMECFYTEKALKHIKKIALRVLIFQTFFQASQSNKC